jgi:CRP-like cAMP-binding protein
VVEGGRRHRLSAAPLARLRFVPGIPGAFATDLGYDGRVIERLLLKLRARDDVSSEEEATLRALIVEHEDVPARRTVLRRGVSLNRSVLLVEGLMCRYKDLGNGRRQITALHVPGDFLDLHGFTLRRLDHEVMSLTPSRMAFAPHTQLRRITETQAHLTRLLWFSTNLDAAIHREWELSLGQRAAVVHAAHLLCELHMRLEFVGLTSGLEFDLPINQTEFGECMGLTVVHTNRVLRELRERELVDFARGRVTIRNLDGLKNLAEFDPGYLYPDKEPR